ncbi:hypothetical protein NLJ89_g11578 [Agrocybe chaxingu]|uniref:Avidin family protein n=1 Tax=Agrocybe chaxingu TaxID=84603 RepID=A0A9W8MMW7_9AGAR|nr:hypothetical protein NLJ89_g11578 [Agrocybe chaxingu]
MSNAPLSGDWYNQLGSKMTLIADNDSGGGLSGEYNSAVGQAKDVYILTGRYDAAPPAGEGTSVGWVVTFRNDILNAHSTSTWSGQYFDGGNERIITQWLLTSSTTPSDVWSSTRIGNDTFTRTAPTAAEIEKARAFTVGSPHPEDIIAMMRK